MAIEVLLKAVSSAQAERLLKGEIVSDMLISTRSATSSERGNVTYLGCGCLMTLHAIILALSMRALLGVIGMIATFVVLEVAAIAMAWDFYRLSRRRQNSKSSDPSMLIPEDACLALNSWHGIHFLLTRTVWGGVPPLDFLIQGGTQLREFAGGGERLLTSAEVQTLACALAAIQVEELDRRYDARTMNASELHPNRWHLNSEREHLLREFQQLGEFVARAAKSDSAISVILEA